MCIRDRKDSSGITPSFPGVDFGTSGDYLDAGTSDDFVFGTGDFTIEMYVYHSSISGQQTYFSDANGNHAGVYFYKTSGHKLGIYYSSQIATGSTSLATNTWYHIAVSRVSGTLKLFLDGVQEASVSNSTTLPRVDTQSVILMILLVVLF